MPTPSSSPATPSRRAGVRPFDLKAHLKQTLSATDKREHLIIGLQNWVTALVAQGAARAVQDIPEAFRPRDGQLAQIEKEAHSLTRKDKHVTVLFTMPFYPGFNASHGIDFAREVERYPAIHYPNHYLQPFHSLPGGWLNPMAATCNEAAMRALYRTAHPRDAEGVRELVAQFVPRDAKVVYDFGGACGRQSLVMAERLGTDAVVSCMNPSPFGLILGRKLYTDPRLRWVHGFAEQQDLPEHTADVVNLFFVMHETPNHIKQQLLDKAFSVLKPGGRLIVTEPPPEDLEIHSRGFFEPYREPWLVWDADRALGEAGFTDIELHHVVDPRFMWTRVAKKPLQGKRLLRSDET